MLHMRKKKKTPKHVLNQAARLFAFMDERPERPQVKRVNTILELLVAIRNEKRFDEKAELIDRVQKAFGRYRWARVIFWGAPGNDQTNIRSHVFITPAKRHPEDDTWEYGAIHILLVIAEYYPDYLSKIERCDVCSRWMLARKSDHRFCSGKCRQYDYDNDPARKEQHRANMRRLYRVERERAEWGAKNARRK